MSISEMDKFIHPLLREIQRKFSNLIPSEVDIENCYSTYMSLRRGATAEAQNRRIPKLVIETNNRWRCSGRKHGMLGGMSMMKRYSDAKACIPTLIQFSYCLGLRPVRNGTRNKRPRVIEKPSPVPSKSPYKLRKRST